MKKAFSIVELLVSIVLISTIVLLLFQVVVSLKTLFTKDNTDTTLLLNQASITYLINSHLEEKGLESIDYCEGTQTNCITITYKDNTVENVEVDVTNSTIKVGNKLYKYPAGTILTLPNSAEELIDSEFVDYDTIYKLNINVTNKLFSNKDYNIDVVYLYSSIGSKNIDLINTLKNDTSSGLVADAYETGRYYFRGANPKNVITLQESTGSTPYRIISFEADGTIKVVREERINTSGNAWDPISNRNSTQDTYCINASLHGCNAWGNMSNTYRDDVLMNDYFSLKYYASNTATSMSINGSESGTKTKVTKESSLNTYLNSTYLTTNLAPISNYIDEHMWDVGGVYPLLKDYDKDIDETKVNQWKGYIALPSIIDYKNASNNTTQCINMYSGVKAISGTSYYPCSKNSDGNINNYLYKSGYTQWFLSVNSYNDCSVWYVSGSGNFLSGYAKDGNSVRPSFYLKSIVKLTGAGTTTSPYTIAS